MDDGHDSTIHEWLQDDGHDNTEFMHVQEIAFYTTILIILKRRRDAQGDNQEPAGIAVL